MPGCTLKEKLAKSGGLRWWRVGQAARSTATRGYLSRTSSLYEVSTEISDWATLTYSTDPSEGAPTGLSTIGFKVLLNNELRVDLKRQKQVGHGPKKMLSRQGFDTGDSELSFLRDCSWSSSAA